MISDDYIDYIPCLLPLASRAETKGFLSKVSRNGHPLCLGTLHGTNPSALM